MTPMPVMVSGAVPVLRSVTVCEALLRPIFTLLKVRLEGETPATGAMPVPVKLTLWVLPDLPLWLSVIFKAPVRVPVAVGLNATLMVQEPPAARLLVQV